MNIFYTDQFVLPLPNNHRFPMPKYALLRERVIAAGVVPPENRLIPAPASDEQLTLAHALDYVLSIQHGTIPAPEMRKIGFPWTPGLVERSRRSVGATIEAAKSALRDGIAVSLAGGTHHAFYDHGGGYCVFNDAVVAARVLQHKNLIRRAVILDCDVHQGDGTAALCADDPSIFTFSIHGENNYPFHKPPSDLDIGLPDETGDPDYLAALREGVGYALQTAQADLAIYLAGADPFIGDKLGRLALSKEGLLRRDRLVLESCAAMGLPVVIVMAGGYAREVNDTVDIHFQTVQLAAQMASLARG
jgi:acetoin utilization deacetylase AcuC-like enzyme